jgi:hypothetical protein
MDHHDDWQHWSEEPAEFADADTADLGGHDDFGHPAGLGHPDEFDAPHEDPLGHPDDLGGDEFAHPVDHGPDLLHEGGDEAGAHDDPHSHDEARPHDEAQPHEVLGADEAGGYEPDHPAFTDPDVTAEHDPAGYGDDFPPPLDLGHTPPEPVDGYPWSDPQVLGDAPTSGQPSVEGGAPPDDLLAYSGMQPPDGDVWSALLGSDDPATSSLARWWGPAGLG